MQKRANRILSMLLALIMVMTMLPATVFANSETDVFAGWSLTLGEDIGVNFYLAEEAANYTVDVTVAGNKAAYTTATKDGYYVVSVNVAAAQMTDVITLNVKNGDTQVHTGEYTVRQYAEKILTGAYDAEVKELVKQMLNLGAAAQTYFAYNPDPLANKDYEIDTPAAVPTEVPAIALEDNLDGVSLYGMSLLFQSKTAVRFYFVVDGDVANYTFKVGGEAWEVKNSEDLYYVEIGDINPQDLGNEITVTVNDALSVSYNPLTYIVRKYNSDSSSAALKDLVQAMYGYHLEALEYQEYQRIIQVGALQQHSNNTPWVKSDSETFIYFNTDAYTATTGEYTSLTADAIKLVRGGEVYSVANPGQGLLVKDNDTQHLLKITPWGMTGEHLPIQAHDYFIIEGRFVSKNDDDTTIQIAKSYIYFDGTTATVSTTEPILPQTYNLGNLMRDPDSGHSWTSGGVYMYVADNDAPYRSDWSLEYAPTSNSVIKRIRGDETIDVAIVGRGTLVKYGANALYLNINSWTMGENQPAQDGDIYIIEGDFYNAATKATIHLSKTYVYLNGADVEFSTEMPTLPTVIEGGVMKKVEGFGWTGGTGCLIFKMDNTAPNGCYQPTTAANVKLIRDGETYDVGYVGQDVIKKDNDGWYTVEFWTIVNQKPLLANDILVIEGNFYNATEDVTMNITKTYVLLNADGSASFSTEMPSLQTIVDAGAMSAHANGSASEIYFSLAANSVPVDEEANYPYTGTVKLVSGSNVSNVNASIVKMAEDQYYLELDGVELADGDYLVVEGAFSNANNGYTMNITTTYVRADGDKLVYSETEPVFETEFALTGLTNHPNGWSAGGIYISHDAHEATVGTDWSVRYRPVSADVIKLVRGGETFNIGQPAGDTLVVYGNTNLYFETKAWTTQGGKLPFVDGDLIIIEGKFKHEASGSILAVEKTEIYVSNGSLIFNPILAGAMSNHANGVSGDGIYASMAENAAPYDDWNIEYTPVTADSYYVIRNGEQINIGIPGRGTLVKYGDTNYFLKINSWCTNNFAYTTDDIIVVDGFWRQNTQGSAIMKIEKTYLYYNGSAWTFATELPSVISGGTMQTHTKGMWNNGISFTMAANNAPFNSDWTLEYNQTSTDNIKIIRGGETISIGIVDRPLIIKISNDEYYLKLEGWTIGNYGLNSTSPITTDDVIIVEGNFVYENVTLNVTKSYVYYNGSAWVCSAEAPVQKNIVDVVELGSHSNGWTSKSAAEAGGMYFTASENAAPGGSWEEVHRYKPVSSDVIKLIRNGVESNIANTGANTIIKYSATEYYFEFWPFANAKPMLAGDRIIIEGLFYNAANDVYINVEKTYIILNADGTTTVLTDADKYINAGAMSAYSEKNWFDNKYNALYFVLASNNAPADEEWNVRYTPKAASNIKLVRGGETFNIGNTGAETIVKIADGMYALALNEWWWSAYAPIQDGDQLIIEGEFANASNGYTLNIDKTCITFISNADDNVVFSTAADTEFGDVLLPNSAKTLKIGMWNGSYHVFEDQQLKELQAAGITKIMGIDTQWIGTTDVNAWLDRVYSYGISVIMDLRNWDGKTVPSYASHPGVLGFLMYDEPCATEFDKLADLKENFDAIDAFDGKLFYVNLFPSCAAKSSLYGGWTIGKNYETHYVQQFLDKLGVEVLSWDNYSLITQTNDTSVKGIRTDYFYNFEVMASKNAEKWYTMLSSGHKTTAASYAIPTAEELRWQMAVAMTYGVQNIDHYTYVSHEKDYSCMVEYDTWKPTALYYDILQVDNEYLAWDNIFMAYNWKGVAGVKAGSSSTMLDMLENNINLSANGLSVSTTQDVLVGVFDYNGDKAYMVTNAGSAGSSKVGDGKNFTMTDATVTLNLADGNYKCAAIIDQGEITYVAVNNNQIVLNVEAYEGVFVIPVLN